MPATIDLQDLLEIDQSSNDDSYIKTVKQEMLMHQVSLDEDIGEPAKYRALINNLFMASENTEFNFLINSAGGSLTSAVAIIEGIKSTDANVRAILIGECHSAASILALSCHEVVVTDSAFMLVHSAQFGTGGGVANVKAHADFSALYINRLLDTIYAGFLTPQELVSVKQGVEYWFDSEEIQRRLLVRQEYQTKKNKATKKTRTTP